MKKRESFNSQWGFILACIGSAEEWEIYGCFLPESLYMVADLF